MRLRDEVQRQHTPAFDYMPMIGQQQMQAGEGDANAATAEAVEQVEEGTAEDAFNKAFEAITSEAPVPQPAPAAPEPPVEDELVEEGILPDPARVAEEARQAAAAEALAKQGKGPDGKPLATPPAPTATPPAPAPAAPAADNDDMFKRLLAAIEKRPAEQPAPAAPETPRPFQPTPFAPEEKKVVEDFYKDWPEIAAAQELVRSREYEALHAHIAGQFATALGALAQEITSLRAQLGQVTGYQAHEVITRMVPDYAAVKDEVVKWVGEQPAYLKSAYEKVMTEGTLEDSVDLINRWRQATGKEVPTTTTAAPTPTPPAPQPPRQKVAVPPGLVQVPTRRTTPPPTAGVPASFEDAFDLFSKMSADDRAKVAV